MNITITGRKFEMTKPLRDYFEEKIEKTLKYAIDVIDIHAIMSMDRYLHTVEIAFNFKKHRIFARESSVDMYSSIDMAVDKIIKQLRRYHDRIKTYKKRDRTWNIRSIGELCEGGI